mmetsp:Transcript_13272/g.26131  ORF Transcript_13272/g.26131 Transcript_13272/m.26131 type:complete len:443 (-) Transcript_13272:55-1383(-)
MTTAVFFVFFVFCCCDSRHHLFLASPLQRRRRRRPSRRHTKVFVHGKSPKHHAQPEQGTHLKVFSKRTQEGKGVGEGGEGQEHRVADRVQVRTAVFGEEEPQRVEQVVHKNVRGQQPKRASGCARAGSAALQVARPPASERAHGLPCGEALGGGDAGHQLQRHEQEPKQKLVDRNPLSEIEWADVVRRKPVLLVHGREGHGDIARKVEHDGPRIHARKADKRRRDGDERPGQDSQSASVLARSVPRAQKERRAGHGARDQGLVQQGLDLAGGAHGPHRAEERARAIQHRHLHERFLRQASHALSDLVEARLQGPGPHSGSGPDPSLNRPHPRVKHQPPHHDVESVHALAHEERVLGAERVVQNSKEQEVQGADYHNRRGDRIHEHPFARWRWGWWRRHVFHTQYAVNNLRCKSCLEMMGSTEFDRSLPSSCRNFNPGSSNLR